MKGLSLALVVVVLLAAALAVPAAAQNPPIELNLVFDDGRTVPVPSGTDVVLWLYWDASAKGLLENMFIRSVSTSNTLYDQEGNAVRQLDPDTNRALWAPVTLIDPAKLGMSCPQGKHWYTDWRYPIKAGALKPGTYTLVSNGTFTRPVNDGYHTCTSLDTGQPMSPPPSLHKSSNFSFTSTITLVIE